MKNILLMGAMVVPMTLAPIIGQAQSRTQVMRNMAAGNEIYNGEGQTLGTLRSDAMVGSDQPGRAEAGYPATTYGYQPEVAPGLTGSMNSRSMSEEFYTRSGEPMPASISVNDEILSEHQVGDVTYVTGGIGEAERRAMDSLRPKYNLRVLNSENNGAFVSDAKISLMDTKGQSLLSLPSEPLFFASLAPGRYMIQAERNGQVKTQDFTVGAGRPAEITFQWM